MDAAAFFGLERDTRADRRWTMPVVDGLSTAGGFLFGGCALGAAIEAMQAETGRPVVWATAQFLDYARPPQVVDIDVEIAAHGRNTTQARALVSVGGREIITVNAALGTRPSVDGEGQWAAMPEVPSPDECAPRRLRDEHAGSIMSRLEMRLAGARDWTELQGEPGDGRASLWARLPDLGADHAATMAILGDYVPFGVGQTLGALAGGNSLDNTVRIAHLEPTEWVLVDVHVHAIAGGFAHGRVHLWSQAGHLLATASQSVIVRYWGGPPPGEAKS